MKALRGSKEERAPTIHYTRSLAEQEDRVATTIWSCFGHLPPVLA